MCESRVIDMKSSQQHVHSSRRADVKSSQPFLMILKSLQELLLHVLSWIPQNYMKTEENRVPAFTVDLLTTYGSHRFLALQKHKRLRVCV